MTRNRNFHSMILASLVFICWSALAVAPARASLIFEVQNFNTLADGTGSFDLLLVNNGPATFHVSTDVVEIAITGATGAVFTDATTGTAATYIYATSFADANGIPLYTGPIGASLTIVDTEFADPFYRVMAPGESYGLAHVSFLDDPTAPLTAGSISVVVDGTTISDEFGNIIYPPAIPEPSSVVLLSIGSLAAIGSFGRFRKRSGPGQRVRRRALAIPEVR